MAYIVQSSERVRGIGTEYETKAMLYLMNCREDSYQINFFAIDFYNDVTGLNALADKAWDVQSKGTKTGGPKEVGKELVTLFKNFMSELNFDYLILFLATVPATLRKDNSLTTFGIENITEGRPLKALREGLVEEAGKKEYISDEWITDANIDAFLNRVTFVVDDKSKAEYVRGIMSVNPKYIPQDNVLDGIFNKIRDAQSAKKNNESVEGEMVTHLREVLYFDRVLKVREIRLMVLNSFINHDVINTPAPQSFYQLLRRFDGLRQKEIIEDCQLQIARLLYDKTYTEEFWKLLNLIYEAIDENGTATIKQLFDSIANEEPAKNPRLDALTVQYLIAVVKEALQ